MFIHGESYEWNSGNPYDGTVMASVGNVVVVTINFRLGILGFLPAMGNSARANNGLLDQIAALHWIRDNIAEFGGDPANVTLAGHGTGAAMAHLLLLAPMAQSLVHRALLMSGSALSPWALARDAHAHARHVARALDCPVAEEEGLVECLRLRPVGDLLRVPLSVPDHLSAFGPTVDGIVLRAEPLELTESLASSGRRLELMMGVSRFESYFFVSASEEKYGIEADRRDRLLRTLVRNLFSFHQQEIFLTIVNEYTDWTKPFQHPLNILDSTGEAVGDALVVAPLVRTAGLLSRAAPTFLYVFAHQAELSSDYPSRLGCVHGEELAFVFGAPLVAALGHFGRNYSRQEQALAEATVAFWTNFVKFGDPSYTGHSSGLTGSELHAKGRFERIAWPPYEPAHQKYLLIGLKPKVKDHYHAHRLSLWLHLIPQLHRPGAPEAHHLLEDHDNPLSYDGHVRSLDGMAPASSSSSSLPGFELVFREPGDGRKLEWCHRAQGNESGAWPAEAASTARPLWEPLSGGGYSTALSVTIAVGCSLLVLNVLIFAGVYYQRDKTRLEAKLHKRSYKLAKPGEPPHLTTAGGKPLALRAPPPSPVGPAGGGGGGANMAGAGNAATLPPKAPPPMPEAQPLLAQGASLARLVLRTRPPEPQENVCVMQWRKPGCLPPSGAPGKSNDCTNAAPLQRFNSDATLPTFCKAAQNVREMKCEMSSSATPVTVAESGPDAESKNAFALPRRR
ncbi:hypothetical protein HPB52_014914 [Rhipicephalus sanguineus]|uniref:Carboxylesterase type B domain-containing protein n=1 Tax=Rhipicephalus sanguineus TaxID=34632 RepID=A0A9D4Q1H1_RHISA|nr:hypothetical protein HPB52_014914 [Rhipicephalus sanguineus]